MNNNKRKRTQTALDQASNKARLTADDDMVVVDTNRAPELGEGDWLDIPYYLPEAAAISGLSQYELLTVLGQRFAR